MHLGTTVLYFNIKYLNCKDEINVCTHICVVGVFRFVYSGVLTTAEPKMFMIFI